MMRPRSACFAVAMTRLRWELDRREWLMFAKIAWAERVGARRDVNWREGTIGMEGCRTDSGIRRLRRAEIRPSRQVLRVISTAFYRPFPFRVKVVAVILVIGLGRMSSNTIRIRNVMGLVRSMCGDMVVRRFMPVVAHDGIRLKIGSFLQLPIVDRFVRRSSPRANVPSADQEISSSQDVMRLLMSEKPALDVDGLLVKVLGDLDGPLRRNGFRKPKGIRLFRNLLDVDLRVLEDVDIVADLGQVRTLPKPFLMLLGRS